MDKNPKNIDDRAQAVMDLLKELYNKKVVSYALSPEHRGEISNPDGHAKITGSCGDTIEIFLKVRGEIVEEAAFIVDGCATTVASANAGVSLIKGKPLRKAHFLTQDRILEELGRLPERDQHCAQLAARAIKAAVQDVRKIAQQPWKELYRKR